MCSSHGNSCLMAVVTTSYRDYEREARQLVHQLLETSLERIHREQSQPQVKGQPTWPLGAEFTIERGVEAIEALVKCWHVSDSWKHCTDFLAEEDKLFSYRVRWSEPTRRKPVPSATASVYFYIQVHSEKSPVFVVYVIEGQKLVHSCRPDCTAFQEVWLRNVIDNKLAVAQAVSW